MSQLKVDSVVDSSGGNTVTINGATPTQYNTMGRNRIINGDMRIDQRNAGAAVTADGAYPVDRFYVTNTTDGGYSAERSTTVPANFVNSIKFTTTTADASLSATQVCSIRQMIEGYNIADFGWGTADAKTITMSFWVRSSLTGTFGGALRNSDNNRSYPFTYSISSADTWEYKTITVAGDTSGTWLTNNGTGIRLTFGLGVGTTYSGTAGAWAGANYVSATGATSVVGTNGATFYITGVQLEVGSVATEFERRPYGMELALCQRYYQKIGNASYAGITAGNATGNTNANFSIRPTVDMRAAPTASFSALIVTDRGYYDKGLVSINGIEASSNAVYLFTTCSGAGTMSYGDAISLCVQGGTTGYLALTAEL